MCPSSLPKKSNPLVSRMRFWWFIGSSVNPILPARLSISLPHAALPAIRTFISSQCTNTLTLPDSAINLQHPPSTYFDFFVSIPVSTGALPALSYRFCVFCYFVSCSISIHPIYVNPNMIANVDRRNARRAAALRISVTCVRLCRSLQLSFHFSVSDSICSESGRAASSTGNSPFARDVGSRCQFPLCSCSSFGP